MVWAQGTFYHTKTSDGKLNQYVPSIIYGFSDDFSIFIQMSKDTLKVGNQSYKGLEDTLFQLEYALHQYGNQEIYTLISAIGGVYAPTSRVPIDKSTTHFFLGSTQVYVTNDYYLFGSFGGLLPAKRKNVWYGTGFLYQIGLGKTITYREHYFLGFLAEFDGYVAGHNTIDKIPDPNSGQHSFLAGPSIYLVTDSFIFQVGMQWPLYQHLNGAQSKIKHIIGLALNYYRQF